MDSIVPIKRQICFSVSEQRSMAFILSFILHEYEIGHTFEFRRRLVEYSKMTGNNATKCSSHFLFRAVNVSPKW